MISDYLKSNGRSLEKSKIGGDWNFAPNMRIGELRHLNEAWRSRNVGMLTLPESTIGVSLGPKAPSSEKSKRGGKCNLEVSEA